MGDFFDMELHFLGSEVPAPEPVLKEVQLRFQQSQKQNPCPEFPFHVVVGGSSASRPD